MLIVLDEEFRAFDPHTRPDLVECLENVLLSHFLGLHSVYGTRAVMEHIRGCPGLSDRARSAASKIVTNASELGGLAVAVERKVQLYPNGARLTGPGQDIWLTDLSVFRGPEVLQAASVVVENSEVDGKFLACCLRGYASINRRPQPSLEYRNGGGDTIANVFVSEARRQLVVICVCDSDRDHPDASVGNTASGVMRAVEHLNRETCGFAEAYILDVREMENFLTSEVMLEFLEHIPERIGDLQTLEGAARSSALAVQIIQFVDLKSGVRPPAGSPNPGSRAYFDGQICSYLQKHGNASNAAANTPYCRCGSNVLRNVILRVMTVADSQKLIGALRRGVHWEGLENLLEALLECGLAAQRMRA